MREFLSHGDEGLLDQSRDKAQTYLKDGTEFALGHAVDIRLGLAGDKFDVAVSYCASELLKTDRGNLTTQIRNFEAKPKFLIPKFLSSQLLHMMQQNEEVLELTEDFLGRTRINSYPDLFPDAFQGPTALAIRQAVHNLFTLERTGGMKIRDKTGLSEWGDHWKERISNANHS